MSEWHDPISSPFSHLVLFLSQLKQTDYAPMYARRYRTSVSHVGTARRYGRRRLALAGRPHWPALSLSKG